MKIAELGLFLFEDARDVYILQQQGEKLTQAAQRDHSAGRLSAPDILAKIREMDPTDGKFLQYLVNQYIKPDEQGNQKYRLEDAERIKKVLQTFTQVKQRLNVTDINQFKNIQDLFATIYDLEQQNKPAPKTKGQEEREVFAGAKVLYKNPDIIIYDLTTPAAARAVALKYQTEWCTLDGAEKAEYYINTGGLYAIIVKKGNKIVPFQLHYESGQVMNAADVPINKKETELLSSFPVWYEFVDWLVKRHYSEINAAATSNPKKKSIRAKK